MGPHGGGTLLSQGPSSPSLWGRSQVGSETGPPLSSLGTRTLSLGISPSAGCGNPFLSHGLPAPHNLHRKIITPRHKGSRFPLWLWGSRPCAGALQTVAPLERRVRVPSHPRAEVDRWIQLSNLGVLAPPAQRVPHCSSLLPQPRPAKTPLGLIEEGPAPGSRGGARGEGFV